MKKLTDAIHSFVFYYYSSNWFLVWKGIRHQSNTNRSRARFFFFNLALSGLDSEMRKNEKMTFALERVRLLSFALLTSLRFTWARLQLFRCEMAKCQPHKCGLDRRNGSIPNADVS